MPVRDRPLEDAWRQILPLILFCGVCLALDINDAPRPEDHFFAKGMGFPVQHRGKLFRASERQGNFTFFDGVESVTVQRGKLRFALTGPKATLGWGNYAGKQSVGEVQDMWQQTNIVQVKARQSAGKSTWSVRLWRDGQACTDRGGGKRPGEVEQAELVAGTWQEIEFDPLRSNGANPDGLEVVVEGGSGTQIEIEWVRLSQPVHTGVCRTEFVLPGGKVWRAVADVGSANERHWMGTDEMWSRLYINGEAVDRQRSVYLYHTAPVDIAPYLKSGRNCAGLHGFRINGRPMLYVQARIVMASGEVVTVTSGRDWKYSPGPWTTGTGLVSTMGPGRRSGTAKRWRLPGAMPPGASLYLPTKVGWCSRTPTVATCSIRTRGRWWLMSARRRDCAGTSLS